MWLLRHQIRHLTDPIPPLVPHSGFQSEPHGGHRRNNEQRERTVTINNGTTWGTTWGIGLTGPTRGIGLTGPARGIGLT